MRDVAIMIVDLDFNVLPAGNLDDYVGNAIMGLPVVLPPAGQSSFAPRQIHLQAYSLSATRSLAAR